MLNLPKQQAVAEQGRLKAALRLGRAGMSQGFGNRAEAAEREKQTWSSVSSGNRIAQLAQILGQIHFHSHCGVERHRVEVRVQLRK